MKEAISCVTETPGGRLGLDWVCVLGSQRSDAGMHHLLDNPILPRYQQQALLEREMDHL